MYEKDEQQRLFFGAMRGCTAEMTNIIVIGRSCLIMEGGAENQEDIPGVVLNYN